MGGGGRGGREKNGGYGQGRLTERWEKNNLHTDEVMLEEGRSGRAGGGGGIQSWRDTDRDRDTQRDRDIQKRNTKSKIGWAHYSSVKV